MSQEAPFAREIAVVLYADVAGYSRLTGADEDGTHRRLSTRLDLLTETIATHGGRVVHFAGDAVLARFGSASAALEAALVAQAGIAGLNAALPAEQQLRFRIGVNLGDVIVDRDDIYGDGVNVAARLETLAEPGGICASEAVRAAVGGATRLHFEPMGEQRVKNIAEPVLAHRVERAESSSNPPAHGPRRRRMAALLLAISLAAALGVLVTQFLPPGAGPLPPDPPPSDPGGAAVAQLAGSPPAPAAAPDAPVELPAAGPAQLVVQPFEFLGDGGDRLGLARGISDDLRTALGRFGAVQVLDPQLAARIAPGESAPLYVIEGSLRQAGTQLRVSSRLLEAGSGRELWGERYDADLNDPFAAQDMVTRHLAFALLNRHGPLRSTELQRLRQLPEAELDAYGLVALGDAVFESLSVDSIAQARSRFERALELDPGYARAHANLAWLALRARDLGLVDDRDAALAEALQQALLAQRIDASDYLAQWALGAAHLYGKQHQQALAAYDRALSLNPADADLRVERGAALIYSGRAAEAAEQIAMAMAQAGLPEDWHAMYLGWARVLAGDDAGAIEALSPLRLPWPKLHRLLAAAHALSGNPAQARVHADTLRVLEPQFTISAFMEDEPYLREALAARLVEGLRSAGLPDHSGEAQGLASDTARAEAADPAEPGDPAGPAAPDAGANVRDPPPAAVLPGVDRPEPAAPDPLPGASESWRAESPGDYAR